MIKSFGDDETEKLFERRKSRVPTQIQRQALKKLLILDAATTLDDLKRPPGNRLEPLKGDRKGQHSIRVNDQYRICFEWKRGDAYDVEVTDYH